MKNGIGIYKVRISEEQIVNLPDSYMPVIRRRVGYEIYFRWSWWGIFDRKLKTVWSKKFKDFPIL